MKRLGPLPTVGELMAMVGLHLLGLDRPLMAELRLGAPSEEDAKPWADTLGITCRVPQNGRAGRMRKLAQARSGLLVVFHRKGERVVHCSAIDGCLVKLIRKQMSAAQVMLGLKSLGTKLSTRLQAHCNAPNTTRPRS